MDLAFSILFFSFSRQSFAFSLFCLFSFLCVLRLLSALAANIPFGQVSSSHTLLNH
ncbi:hypothetical protein L228DRAFT_25222 [Xylona heveae TC161]|uniref:Uncharacterized protein n=1 Tax=Xylona heveae (strain CBS 132557 / TC161) TaxID=1328760 RepID=A0A165ACS1_XYLHT|nr:hypothetical protein L228DRAFT_25222 [Xylona heveae TC161]KZF20263.1 hypothetical protein L228DRAFT_25222 [Xylona heveae TC161]